MKNVKKTALVLGAGFAGCTAAYLLEKKGFEVTVLEKDAVAGGGCRTYLYAGHPYTFGPRIFFSKDGEIIKLMFSFLKMRKLNVKTMSFIEKDNRFYHYPIFAPDIEKMPDKKEIREQLKKRKGKKPRADNFENYWLDAIGPNLYNKFVNDYSKKMWGVENNKELSADFNWVNRGTPIRKKDSRLYKDMFNAYPENYDGYNQFFDKALSGCRVVFNCGVKKMEERIVKTDKGDFTADVIINTLSLDDIFDNVFGSLKYEGRNFLKFILPKNNVLPKDISWVHYSGKEPFTRITEFKKITNYKGRGTLMGIEIPSKNGKYYPLQTKEEKQRFLKYKEIFPKDFYSIGRLGTFTYKGIPDVMRDALELEKYV
jgi:UDP-galactopyranose mutase